jgi:hypothetical protein
MDERTRNHLEQVRQWLKDNVRHYSTPNKVTLYSFDVDWGELSGSFRVLLDDKELSEELTLAIDQSGKVNFYLPMFHSPLGAPASYAAIELTEITSRAILEGLRKAIPRIMGCGINRETGKEVFDYTPVQDRILDKEEFELSRKQVSSPDYSITIETNHA